MKKITVFISAAIMLVTFFAAMSFTPLPAGPSANGQGSLTRPGDVQRRFSFHANTMPDASVQGSGVLTLTGGGNKIEFTINCLTISGKTATMSGVITAFRDDPSVVGSNCWFRVEDNGEGSNASPDRITLLVYFPLGGGVPCTGETGFELYQVEGGNIQVKP